jgi:hypothetical protein
VLAGAQCFNALSTVVSVRTRDPDGFYPRVCEQVLFPGCQEVRREPELTQAFLSSPTLRIVDPQQACLVFRGEPLDVFGSHPTDAV